MNLSRSTLNRRAFTLLELLIVVAIIGILAAILFPVFARARENGRRASCQSNLKQIGLGLTQYSQDFDEVLVSDWYGDIPANGYGPSLPPSAFPSVSYKWEDAAYPYFKNEQVFDCPSATDGATVPYTFYQNLTAAPSITNLGSYVIVHGYGANQPTLTPPVSHALVGDLVNLARAETPSTTAWVMDGNGNFYVDVNLGTPRDRHLETINVLFLDGHVKALKLENLIRKNAAGTIRAFTLQDD